MYHWSRSARRLPFISNAEAKATKVRRTATGLSDAFADLVGSRRARQAVQQRTGIVLKREALQPAASQKLGSNVVGMAGMDHEHVRSTHVTGVRNGTHSVALIALLDGCAKEVLQVRRQEPLPSPV